MFNKLKLCVERSNGKLKLLGESLERHGL